MLNKVFTQNLQIIYPIVEISNTFFPKKLFECFKLDKLLLLKTKIV